MGLFRKQAAAPTEGGRRDTIAELERLVRRVAALPLAAPILLLGGIGLGKLTARALDLPDDAPVLVDDDGKPRRIRFDELSEHFDGLRSDGERTAEYVALYRVHVAPVEESLRRRGVPGETARKVAWPLVEYSYRRGLDPATVLSVLLVESNGRPTVTSDVGARGLMQVMPAWAGHWRDCGHDLYDIEDNLCNGTSILAWNLRRYGGDERRALLSYNGCVRGTNTPDCSRYPDKVFRLRRQILAEWSRHRPTLAVPAAAP